MNPACPVALVAGITLGIFFMLAVLAAFAGKTNPDPERRQRHGTRDSANKIAAQFFDGALTYAQASTRLREIEVPTAARTRLLARRLYERPPSPRYCERKSI